MALVLEKDSTEARERSISVEDKLSIGASERNDEEGGGDKGCFKGIEGVDSSLRDGRGEGDGRSGEICQRRSNLGEVTDETAVETNKAKEGPGSCDVVRQKPVSDSSNLLGIHTESFGGNNVAEVTSGLLSKGAFGELYFQVGGVEGGEDLLDVLKMLLFSFGVNQDVVEVTNNKAVEEGLKNRGHETREGSGGVGETKRHDSELISAVTCFEGGLMDVVGVDAALMVTRVEVEGGEELGTV